MRNTRFLITLRVYKVVCFIIFVLCGSLILVYQFELKFRSGVSGFSEMQVLTLHRFVVDQFFERHRHWELSKLGELLYKNEKHLKRRKEKLNSNYTILIWQYYQWLKHRHVYQYGDEAHDPLLGCSVKNCIFTGDDSSLETADAVVVHLQHGKVPAVGHRRPDQRWIFLTDEAPGHTFTLSSEPVPLSALHNVFNWSMTYRSNSDVPVPYGRTVGLKEPKYLSLDPPVAGLIPYWKQKRRDVLVAILISNCGVPYRTRVIEGLQQFVRVDVHGACGDGDLKETCPGHFRADCQELSNYLFYLALENSKCEQYMTEKLFYNAYHRGAIPIIQGASLKDCEELLPPNSYLHLDNYESLKDLADDMLSISEDLDRILYYHQWRNHFEVLNEHGFFQTKSYHFCRVCEALNFNAEGVSVYSEERLGRLLNPALSCRN